LRNRGLLSVIAGLLGEGRGLKQTGWCFAETGVIFIQALGDPVVVSMGDSLVLGKLVGRIRSADFAP
jgi:hypothetical protein